MNISNKRNTQLNICSSSIVISIFLSIVDRHIIFCESFGSCHNSFALFSTYVLSHAGIVLMNVIFLEIDQVARKEQYKLLVGLTFVAC